MHWLRTSGISIFIAAAVWLAIGVPSVLGFVMLKHDTQDCCSHQQPDEHQDDADSGDHDCRCLAHGGTMVIPEPASVPVPFRSSRADYFAHSVVLPEPLALAIEYPPQR